MQVLILLKLHLFTYKQSLLRSNEIADLSAGLRMLVEVMCEQYLQFRMSLTVISKEKQ